MNTHLEAALGRQRRAVRRLVESLLEILVALLLFGMMAVTVIDVFGRYLLSQPLPGAFELAEVMLALSIFIALPLVCLREEHISVSLLTDRLSPRAREIHAGIAALIGSVVFGLVAWRLAVQAGQLASYGEVTIFLRIPKGPIGQAMAACTALAALALLLVAVDHFVRMNGLAQISTRRDD